MSTSSTAAATTATSTSATTQPSLLGNLMSRVVSAVKKEGYDEKWLAGQASDVATTAVKHLGVGNLLRAAADLVEKSTTPQTKTTTKSTSTATKESSLLDAIGTAVLDTVRKPLEDGVRRVVREVNEEVFPSHGAESSDAASKSTLESEMVTLMGNLSGAKKSFDKGVDTLLKLADLAQRSFKGIAKIVAKVPVIGKPISKLSNFFGQSITKLIQSIFDNIGKLFQGGQNKAKKVADGLDSLIHRIRNTDVHAMVNALRERLGLTPGSASLQEA